jgi:hypothetical protein
VHLWCNENEAKRKIEEDDKLKNFEVCEIALQDYVTFI